MLILQEVEFSSNRCVGRPGDSYCRLLLAVAILAICIILTLKEEGKDDEDFKGFCVFGGKMALFGHNGLSVTDIDVKMTSAHRSIRYVNNTIVTPVSTRLVAPVINWFYKRL